MGGRGWIKQNLTRDQDKYLILHYRLGTGRDRYHLCKNEKWICTSWWFAHINIVRHFSVFLFLLKVLKSSSKKIYFINQLNTFLILYFTVWRGILLLPTLLFVSTSSFTEKKVANKASLLGLGYKLQTLALIPFRSFSNIHSLVNEWTYIHFYTFRSSCKLSLFTYTFSILKLKVCKMNENLIMYNFIRVQRTLRWTKNKSKKCSLLHPT